MDEQKLLSELQFLRDQNARLLSTLESQSKEEIQRKNLNFVQLYKNEIKSFRSLVILNRTAAQILLIFVEKMNKQNAIIMSYKTLGQITRKTRQTCSTAIKVLREQNFINIVKVGSANAYVINSNVFWSTDNVIKEKFAIFTATVYASASEQDEDYENWSNVKLKQIPIVFPHEIANIVDTDLIENDD